MNELKIRIFEKVKNPKFLVIAGIIGILLIFLSSLISPSKEEKEIKSTEFSVEEYRKSLEDDIKYIVKDITGSRDVSVVITLENSLSFSYADTKEETSADKSESSQSSTQSQLKEGYVTVKTSDGGEEALIVTTGMPEIRGVAIVCSGGDNEYINQKIQNAVTAALNITNKRVYICGRKQ